MIAANSLRRMSRKRTCNDQFHDLIPRLLIAPLSAISPHHNVRHVTSGKIQPSRSSGEGAKPPRLIRRLFIRALGLIAMP